MYADPNSETGGRNVKVREQVKRSEDNDLGTILVVIPRERVNISGYDIRRYILLYMLRPHVYIHAVACRLSMDWLAHHREV